jgi:hypothetical protein
VTNPKVLAFHWVVSVVPMALKTLPIEEAAGSDQDAGNKE